MHKKMSREIGFCWTPTAGAEGSRSIPIYFHLDDGRQLYTLDATRAEGELGAWRVCQLEEGREDDLKQVFTLKHESPRVVLLGRLLNSPQ